jgi:CheY-like chemotaxis protein
VEDEEMNYLLLKELLESRGAILLWAENGEKALQLIRQHPDVFLVLMDIRMPVMNGIEATRQIKDITPDLPVIALTAYNMQEDKEKAIQSGCDAFLTKPVQREELFFVIGEVTDKG